MSEKGFKVIVKINLPPEKQYHAGHSIIVQGDTINEVRGELAGLVAGRKDVDDNDIDRASFILLRFGEYALGGAAQQALTSGATPESPAAGPVTSSEAAAPDLASKAVLAAVAKKTGKSVEELGELTKAQAQELLKGGGK